MRARVFIDFWNFQLEWRNRANEAQCDWKRLGQELTAAASGCLPVNSEGLVLEETRVYASYEKGRDGKLAGWLHNFLDMQPGVRVFATERQWKARAVHCRWCQTRHELCPMCNKLLGRASEKAIDARIVTDMLALAWEDAYDVAILVTSDKDFIPAVETLQTKNIRVVNATWRGLGRQLAQVSWASFEIDDLIAALRRA